MNDSKRNPKISLNRLYWKSRFFKNGSQIPHLLKHLEKSDYYTISQIEAYQFEKIKKLLIHASKNVPYYQKLFKKIPFDPKQFSNLSDLSRIPVLNKQKIRENFSDLKSTVHESRNVIRNHTGGSTGEPLVFFQDKNYKNWADAVRIRGWYRYPGYDFGARTVQLWGASRDFVDLNRNIFKDIISAYCLEGKLLYNTFVFSEKEMWNVYRSLKLVRPDIMIAYGGNLYRFAKYLNKYRFKPFYPGAIIFSAEGLTSEQRALVESVFKQTIYNSYGGRELSLTAIECSEHSGLHVQFENNFIEFQNESNSMGKRIASLLITNLNNYAMPFIRYEIGDLVEILPDGHCPCPCGRHSLRLGPVMGRTLDTIYLPDGTQISPLALLHFIGTVPGVDAYQIVQKTMDEIEIYIQSENESEELSDIIRSILKKEISQNMTSNIVFVSNIDRTQTGKQRFIVSELST